MCNTGRTHLVATGLYHTNNIRETVHNINSLRLDFLTVILFVTLSHELGATLFPGTAMYNGCRNGS